MRTTIQTLRTTSIVAGLLLLPAALFAVDGVILIDQNKAMAGGVTVGDTPGFPVTISQPGSYRLDGNLTLPDINTSAILVAADNVTIDLNGFSIIGPNTCAGLPMCTAGTSFGILGEANTLTVRNGMIQGMSSAGIYSFGNAVVIEEVQVSYNNYGMELEGTAIIRDCIAENNFEGITLFNGGTIFNVVAAQNYDVGIYGSFLRVTNSVMVYNSYVGLDFMDENGSSNYSSNLLALNSVHNVLRGINTGQNVCDGILCP